MSQQKMALLLGGNKLNAGILAHFHDCGYAVCVVDWNEHPALTGELHLRLDVKKPGPILAELERRGLLARIQTGFTSIDVAVPTLAAVLGRCGMKVNTPEGLAVCFSKSKMTEIWEKAGILNREVRRFAAWSDEIAAWNERQKLIVKPDNAASSRGITILEKGSSADEAKTAFEKALANASDALVVVEEFVVGTEFTVEMLGDAEGHVAVYAISVKTHTKNTDRNKIAVKLHYNAVADDLQERIASVAVQCFRTLGFRSTMGHLEILLKPDGTLSPVEIGARSSGFIASDLVDVVSGRSFLGDLENVQHGATVPDGLLSQTDRSSMYFFYDLPGGSVIREVCTLLDFCDPQISSRAHDRAAIVLGRRIENIDNDNARIGLEVLEGPRALMTPDYVAAAERRMLERMVGANA